MPSQAVDEADGLDVLRATPVPRRIRTGSSSRPRPSGLSRRWVWGVCSKDSSPWRGRLVKAVRSATSRSHPDCVGPTLVVIAAAGVVRMVDNRGVPPPSGIPETAPESPSVPGRARRRRGPALPLRRPAGSHLAIAGSADSWPGELRSLCDRVFRSVIALLEAADHNKPGDKHGHHRDEQS